MRNGQFFMLSLLILSGIILGAVAMTNSVSSSFGSSILAQSITEQTDAELSYSIGAAAESGKNHQGQLLAARAFSDFRAYVEQQRRIETDSLYIIGTPTTSGLTVSVTNLQGGPLQDAWLVIDGNAEHLGTIPGGATVVRTFPSTESTIDAKMNSTSLSHTFTTPRKTFLFLDSSSRFGSSVFSDVRLY